MKNIAKNLKKAAPPQIVNTTGAFAGTTAVLLTMINTMPDGVSEAVKDWLLWGVNGMAMLTAALAGVAAFSKTDMTDPKDPPPPKP